MSKNRNTTQNRYAVRCGTRAFVSGAGLLVLLVGIVILMYALPSRITRIDVAESNITRISKETERFAASLGEDVRIYWLCEGGETDGQLDVFLSRYTDAGDRISVTVIDTTEDPDFYKTYAAEAPTNLSLIVESDRRNQVVDSLDLYYYTNEVIDSLYGSTTKLSYDELVEYQQRYANYLNGSVTYQYFQGEALLTSALDYVTAADIPCGYLLTGHGETALPKSLSEALEAYGMAPESLDLGSAGAVPSDAACLILCDPAEDISQAEHDLLCAYLDKGGSLLLVTDPDIVAACPRVASLGESFGLSAQEGVVIDNDATHSYGNSVYQLVPDAGQYHYVSYLLKANGYTARMPQSHGIAISPQLPAGVSAQPLLSTSASGNRLSAEGQHTALGKAGVVHVAVAAEKPVTRADGTADKSQMIWFGSTEAFTESTAQTSSYGNYYYFIFSLTYMSDTYRSDYEALAPVDVNNRIMSDLDGLSSIIWIVVVVAVIPIGLLVTGLIIWSKRRKK